MPIYAAAVSFTIGFCLFIANFALDLEEKLHQLNQYIISLKDKELSAIERIELKKKFIQIVQFHSEARELSIDSQSYRSNCNLFNLLLFSHFISFAIRFLHMNEGAVFVCPLYTIVIFSSLALQASDVT